MEEVKVKTYVSSYTYDTLLNIMYPDNEAKMRSIPEVERLIVQGHTVEYRFGVNQSTVLDMDKFNEFIRPKQVEEPTTPLNINELEFQAELNNLYPQAPEVSVEPVIEEQPVNVTLVAAQEVKPAEGVVEEVNLKGEEIKPEEKVEENTESKEDTEKAGKTKKDIVEKEEKPSTNNRKENKK